MDETAYRRLFTRLADSLSRRLVKILFAFFVLLLLTQLLMQIDSVRSWLSRTYRLEGEGYVTMRTEGRCIGSKLCMSDRGML